MTAIPAGTSGCPYVPGPIEIWADIGEASAMKQLGWTGNGLQIESRPFISPIPSDENGGDQGVPADYQLFGQQHRVTMELTKYNNADMALLERFYNPNTAGANVGVGMLLGCGGAKFRLLLRSTIVIGGTPNFIRNYLGALLLDPIERSPVGSQASRARLTFTCNPVAGVLYNTSDAAT